MCRMAVPAGPVSGENPFLVCGFSPVLCGALTTSGCVLRRRRADREGELSEGSSIRTLVPFTTASALQSDHLPKASLLTPSH